MPPKRSRTWNRVHHGVVQQELRFQKMLVAVQAGDRESIGDAYQSLQPGLLNYLRAVAGSEAEDIAAQSWLDVVSGVGRFKGDEAAFRSWVFTIARRRVADSQRRWWRRPRLIAFDGFDDVPANGDLAAGAVDFQHAIDQLKRLPPDLAEIVFLRVVAGFSAGEVGQITGRPASTIRVLQHRALHRLAHELNRGAETS
jgi:RNA polymerase sigma-70 factor (ECF subfamily)